MLETKSIKGRICYRDKCPICNKDRGFVKKDCLGKKCKSCSTRFNKLGRPSPKKGIKTGLIPHNKGKYSDNSIKKILRNRVSRRMRHALSGRCLSKKWLHIFSILGYSVEALIASLESKFQPGMTWENIGEWHIDHVVPESWFNYSSMNDEEFKKCWELGNLQPLWAHDNIMKSNKFAGYSPLNGGYLYSSERK